MVNDYLTHKVEAAHELLLTNSPVDWLIAGIAAAAAWSALWLLRHLIASRHEKLSTAQQRLPIRLLGDLITHTRQFLFLAVALYAAEVSLTLPPKIEHTVYNIVLILILLQVGLWAGRALRFYLQIQQLERGADKIFAGSLDIINFVAGMLIWSLVILVALDNLGVNITALLAGLGVGGVAVALALQSVLGDLFASLSIALDKPFVVGDSLVIDTFTGTVEHIGIKSTRLRSETGEQIVISNTDMLKSRVRNFGRAREQRAQATIRVSYDTPADKLRRIPKLFEDIVREQAHARFDRCHLKTLGESSLHFELSYFVQEPSVNPLLDLQQAVNLRIIDELHGLGVAFAYPAQFVMLGDARAAAPGIRNPHAAPES
jgi:small-conductance mechanosensitive channel